VRPQQLNRGGQLWMLRDLNGFIPDAQMVEEIALALAVHRRR
jgi:hypothetical protein